MTTRETKDIVDREIERAERDASPERFGGTSTAAATATGEPIEPTEPIERISSLASSNSSNANAARERTDMERIPTQRDVFASGLEKRETALSRIETQRTQHTGTVGATLRSNTRSATRPMPRMGQDKPYPPNVPDVELYLVEFDGADDPLHPQNWPLRKKIFTGAILAYTTFVAVFGSSIFSAGIRVVSAEFGVSTLVGTLGTSLYVLGFAFGPTIWAPLSELRGRRLPVVIAAFGMTVFHFATAVGKDIQTVMICRFFGGFFASAPLAVVAAVFADIFDNKSRGLAVTVFSLCVFTGPLLAPFVGGFIVLNPNLGWRWTEYIEGILCAIALVLDIFFMTETYPPIVLISKAEELRRRTKNWGIHAKQEEVEVDFRELVTRNFTRPIRMLFTEPIVLLLTIYMSFIYGLLYLFLTAYPLIFQGVYRFNGGVGGLPFFGMTLGQVLACAIIVLRQPSYVRKLTANGNRPVPEWRLPEVVVGGVAFAGGLFWLGWSGYSGRVHWIVPTLSGLLSGLGIMLIFLQSLNYLVDAYLMFAASAIAANTLLRSLCGAAFPLFATQMFQGMGIQWACTLLGCLATAMIPVPLYFIYRGEQLRSKSKFAPTFPSPPARKEKEDV